MPRGDSTRRPSAFGADGSAPSANLIVREHRGRVFYEAKFRVAGRQVMRRVGPAWLERGADGNWRPRRGRVPAGAYDVRRATVRASELVAQYMAEVADVDRAERERRACGVTFREVAAGYLGHLEDVKGARPSTLRQHRSDLGEPDVPYRRGPGTTNGHVMRALGDLSAAKITTSDIDAMLATIAATGVSPRTVNRTRQVVSAVFSYGRRACGLRDNPVSDSDRRREPHPAQLAYYQVEDIEALARAFRDGLHRKDPAARSAADIVEDSQDAEAVRVSAYSGIRLGELLALRWSDIDFANSAMTISRALSAGIEGPPKSGRIRRVPLSDQAAAALERLSRREDFIGDDERVFCSLLGRHLDGSALRRRYKHARDAAGLRPLRWHDLRHSFGSLLVANGMDLQSVREAMGHGSLTTTARYLHAAPATVQAAAFSRAFTPVAADPLPPSTNQRDLQESARSR